MFYLIFCSFDVMSKLKIFTAKTLKTAMLYIYLKSHIKYYQCSVQNRKDSAKISICCVIVRRRDVDGCQPLKKRQIIIKNENVQGLRLIDNVYFFDCTK